MTDYNPNFPTPEDRSPVRLNRRDWDRIDSEVDHEIEALGPIPSFDDVLAAELEALGPEPTAELLNAQGYTEDTRLIDRLNSIANFGRVATLLIAETIQSVGALIIAVFFAILEFQRVANGAHQLGQDDMNAALIALAIVAANVVHPIYALRELRGHANLTVTHMTARGHFEAFWRRLWGKPSQESVDLYYNPVLHLTASVITWSTILLAVYDLLSPLLTQLAQGALAEAPLISGLKLIIGGSLSVAGVFFLQAAAHEIGVRTLSDQPQKLSVLLQAMAAERTIRTAEIRESVRASYEAALKERRAQEADIRRDVRERHEELILQERKVDADKPAQLEVRPLAPTPMANGYPTNGNGNGNGHHP